jgi:hypothetical protein
MTIGPVAWVESPLQLLGALEHAALARAVDPSERGPRGGEVIIVPRAGDAQLERTAALLDARCAEEDRGARRAGGLPVSIRVDRRLMPRGLFRSAADWIIGDAYSGLVQQRLESAEPAQLTIVDDGAITRRLARQLQEGAPLLRPVAPRLLGAARERLAARTTVRLRSLAAQGRLRVTTYLDDDDEAPGLLRALGAEVVTHRFDRTRALGMRAAAVPPAARIVLGSAGVADGIASSDAALERLAALAAEGPVAYFPHRREPRWFLQVAARLRTVRVMPALVPIELALAGTPRPLDIVSPPSTAAETLPIVLRGTGSTVRRDTLDVEVRR